MEHQEPLEAGAGVDKLPDPVEHQVDDLLADGVVAPRVVVRRVLLPGDQLLGVEQLAVSSRPDFVHNRWLQVDENCPRHMLPRVRLQRTKNR